MMAPRGEEENGAILAGWNIKRVAPSIIGEEKITTKLTHIG